MEIGLALLISGIIASLISGGVSLSGNKRNLEAQQSANETNLQMTRETNQTNREIWEDTKEYNSPSNQMAMLKAAGINPVTAYGSVSSGSRAVPIEMDAPQVFPELQDLSGVSNAISGLFGNISGALMTEQEINLKKEAVDAQKFTNELNDLTKANQILKYSLDNKLIDAQTHSVLSETINRKMDLWLKGQTVESQLMIDKANLGLLAEQTNNEKLKGSILGIQESMLNIEKLYYDDLKKSERDFAIDNVVKQSKEVEKLKSEIAINWKNYEIKEKELIANSLGIDLLEIEKEIRETEADITEEKLNLLKWQKVNERINAALNSIDWNIKNATIDAVKKRIKWEGESAANNALGQVLTGGLGAGIFGNKKK